MRAEIGREHNALHDLIGLRIDDDHLMCLGAAFQHTGGTGLAGRIRLEFIRSAYPKVFAVGVMRSWWMKVISGLDISLIFFLVFQSYHIHLACRHVGYIRFFGVLGPLNAANGHTCRHFIHELELFRVPHINVSVSHVFEIDVTVRTGDGTAELLADLKGAFLF